MNRPAAQPHTEAAGRVETVGEMARIAGRRARRFGLAPRLGGGGTGMRLLRGWIVAATWPLALVSACADAAHMRTLAGASATVKTAAPAGRRLWRFAAVAQSVAVLWIAVVISCALGALLAGSGVVRIVCAAAVLVLFAPPAVAAVVQTVRSRREPEMALRNLDARRDALAGEGAGYTLSEVLAAHDHTGEGTALMEALKRQWLAEAAVVVLYPATEPLAGYYARLGAVRDENADRRMLFDYRPAAAI